jgi:hypothetical protein
VDNLGETRLAHPIAKLCGLYQAKLVFTPNAISQRPSTSHEGMRGLKVR